MAGSQGTHLAFACGGEIARIDVVGAVVPEDCTSLEFLVLADGRLEHQLAALRRVLRGSRGVSEPRRLVRQHVSLLALDAHMAGAGLRETAELILGPGDWPGDGEHRKSQVRRLIESGAALLERGAAAVFR
ncbi:DNA -binding domain-containing protein [Novosphingobium kaempferiae]|uniref:DNA -binding domain-containing protein n=1 Tax=Novosphingobium kaempferiae TaxID=2896849 RepID=UPI001E4C81A3|nr:DUF2285 domain-containing protein [Novosphingobium kaempferiae]